MKTRKSSTVENIAYKFLAKPDIVHTDGYFPRWFGCRRFLWNAMLSDKRDFYKIMGSSLNNEVTDYKDVFPFLCEVDSLVLANVKLSLNRAYEAFFPGTLIIQNSKRKIPGSHLPPISQVPGLLTCVMMKKRIF